MRVLFLTDRVSLRGGADHHLLQVVRWAVGRGAEVAVAAGRLEGGVLPPGARGLRLKGLGSMVESRARLAGLGELLAGADLVHVQNVMNPVALAAATATGRAIVTVQDHRLFCPGPGKTLPDGRPCGRLLGDEACRGCLPDETYRRATLALTLARRDAARGGRLLVLSRYMARELEAAGLAGAEVLPPFVEVSTGPVEPGEGFALGGRLVAHKALDLGHEAWRRAATGQALRVAGAGPLEGRLPGAELLGWLDGAALRALLRRSRALLFPGRWQEPLGILALEALAEGTPVVAVASGGTEEWSDRGCLVVPAGDVEAMAGAVRRLAGDPTLAARLGGEGRAAVASRYGRVPIERRLGEIYEEVLAEGPQPPTSTQPSQ